ncbi:helix-turn-helix domain-containing protein [Chryseobacterium lathyri]|uniref:helix-turn-helix domain-containing protein n=1 Tax=Chryseobacterium lathyri TaxID=395933 RepID=UPI001CC03AC2|nr:AraC family transcriptional regulator [Chryseobacterium lathyri]
MEEHKKRIIKAIKYIDSNLDADLSLEKIAEIATYSSFHFHRIFKLTTGETLQNYIIRKKIEKSALYLAVKKEIQLKDIYLDLGFSNHSVFSKTFKKYYGIAPSSFRNSAPETFHKILQIQSKNGQVDTVFSQYICTIENLLNWTKMNLKIEVKQLPEMDLAVVMSLGIANVEPSYNTLIEWAKKKQLFPRENVKMISV